jgi:hypothetical protein
MTAFGSSARDAALGTLRAGNAARWKRCALETLRERYV